MINLDSIRFFNRRIEFYKRIGYHVNTFNYIQPPYAKDKSAVPMLIISYPRILTEKEYENMKNQIYFNVYNTSEEQLIQA